MMKAWLCNLAIATLSIASLLGIESKCYAGAANLVVMQANPNGAPTGGIAQQYLLGIQVTGISGPTFLGSNLINFAGSIGNATPTAAGTYYTAGKALFQSEADLANGVGAYSRTNDSYFASPWQTLIASPNGAGESASSLFIDGGIYGALPSKVPSNGTYPFAYIDVTAAAGVTIQGTFAIGTEPAPIGNGGGLKLTLDGQLLPLVQVNGDYNSNGLVDAADYVIWRKRNGQNYTLPGEKPGATTPGVVDAEDYAYWRSRYGANSGSGSGSLSSSAVPEPATVTFFIFGFMIAAGLTRQRKFA